MQSIGAIRQNLATTELACLKDKTTVKIYNMYI